MQRKRYWIALYGLLVVAVPVATQQMHVDGSADRAQAEDAAKLTGLWSRRGEASDADGVRFYYFHGDGKGLYRYGKTGFTNTHSFDYGVDGEDLLLVFRKTGERHRVAFRIEVDPHDRNREWLVLHNDPREPEATRYVRERAEPVASNEASVTADESGIGGRMWINMRRFVSGGSGFEIYQLNDAGIDGRGIGWHHRGDFDEWSTESLVYRVVGDALELQFERRKELASTAFVVHKDDGERVLTLSRDPRNYWQQQRFLDGGRSFGMHAFAFVLDRSTEDVR